MLLYRCTLACFHHRLCLRTSAGGEEDSRKKRFPADKAYYIAKELLMTERTYRKDLQVLNVWFKQVSFIARVKYSYTPLYWIEHKVMDIRLK